MFTLKKVAAFSAISLLLMAGSCDDRDTSSRGVAAQETNMDRAMSAYPVPEVTNFTTRRTVTRWVETANEPDQTHYIYVLLPGVGYMGYYVADSAPVNICTSLTPPQRFYRSAGGGTQVLGPAPALDGVYYGGAGCDMWYFFDALTGAKIEIGGPMAFYTTNVPLDIDVPELRIRMYE